MNGSLQLLPKDRAFDFVLGSDLVYTAAGAECLPLVLAAHCHAHTRVFYAHTKGRFEHLEMDFFSALNASGLVFDEVCHFVMSSLSRRVCNSNSSSLTVVCDTHNRFVSPACPLRLRLRLRSPTSFGSNASPSTKCDWQHHPASLSPSP